MTPAPIVGWVELSGENPELARAELDGALAALGGRRAANCGASAPGPGFEAVELPAVGTLVALAGRLAFARRVLRALSESSDSALEERFRREGSAAGTAAFRPLAASRGTLVAPSALRLADAFRAGGGRIDLDHPDRRFWVQPGSNDHLRAFEEVAAVDRTGFNARRMPRLPFQRPVSLAPRLGRIAANLAAVRPGDPIVDPFVGTGALLLEAALLGGRVSGVDRDPEMVRGAVRNLGRFGVAPERLSIGDAADAFAPSDADGWAAVLTDPPYGRASGSAGEPPDALVGRVLPRWAERVRPSGRVVVVLPGGPDPLPAPWVRTVSVADRVHRSLTREFRVYRRAGELD